MAVLESIVKENAESRAKLIDQLPHQSGLDFLLDAVMLLEQRFGKVGPSTRLQTAVQWFGDLLKEVFWRKAFKLPDGTEEEIYQRLHNSGQSEHPIPVKVNSLVRCSA